MRWHTRAGCRGDGSCARSLGGQDGSERERGLSPGDAALGALLARMKATAGGFTRDNWDKCRWAFRQLGYDAGVSQNPRGRAPTEWNTLTTCTRL